MLVNSLLVRWSGGWSTESDAASIGTYGNLEATLGLGAVQTPEAVAEIAATQLGIYATPREEYDLGIEPISDDDTPYVSYLVGDTVTVTEPGNSPVVERVMSMTVTSDPQTGRALFSPTIKDVLLSEQERVSQGFKKMSNGTLRGDSKVSTPVNNVPPPQSAALTKIETALSGTYTPVVRTDAFQPTIPAVNRLGWWWQWNTGENGVGNLVVAKFKITWGTPGTGSFYRISLPFPGFGDYAGGFGMLFDLSSLTYRTVRHVINSTGSTNDSATGVEAYYADPALVVGPAAPWAWAAGDFIEGTCVYRRNDEPIFIS